MYLLYSACVCAGSLNTICIVCTQWYTNEDVNETYRRSASVELAKTHTSPGRLPNLEPSGSVLMTCSIAFPTRPEPPVTSMVDIARMCQIGVAERGKKRSPSLNLTLNLLPHSRDLVFLIFTNLFYLPPPFIARCFPKYLLYSLQQIAKRAKRTSTTLITHGLQKDC